MEDPKRIVVEVVGRLGRETQIHLDERHHHFRITNLVIVTMSLLLLILAVFNIYYIHILYQDLTGIVNNMDSMHTNLKSVNNNMITISGKMKSIAKHVDHMEAINNHTDSITKTLPKISTNMHKITAETNTIGQEMTHLGGGMNNIELRFGQIGGSVAVMRENVRQISRPMGFMNPIMP
ncbi:MAG: translation initiation factor 2 [Candidatus Sedimenticola sp. (ex Thyasira tokunagai)]